MAHFKKHLGLIQTKRIPLRFRRDVVYMVLYLHQRTSTVENTLIVTLNVWLNA